jgi:hypothetical protein
VPVVGEAHIVVRALTNKVAEDIRKGFDGVKGDIAARTGADLGEKFSAGFNKNANQNIFTKIADGIGSMAPAADSARLQLNSLIKTGYKMTVGFSLIAGTIGVVIGGLGALIGAAGGAAASMTALIGTMVALKVGSGLAGFALGGVGQAVSAAGQASGATAKTVKQLREEMQQLRFEAEEAALAEEEAGLRMEQARENLARTADLPVNSMARREAELNFKQAELAYRQAKDRTKDLNDEVKKGVASGAAVGGADPFAALTASQKKFAQYLVTLKPILDDLKERVASGFLPELEKQLRKIVDSDLLGVVEKGYSGIGDALGKAVKGFTGQILEPEALKNLGGVFSDIEYVVGNFGKTFGKFFRIFLKLLDASGPLIRKFSDYLGGLADRLLIFLDGFSNTELEGFFTRAGDLAGKFSQIFRNVFDGLRAIIMANFGPGSGGDMILDFLIESTEGFSKLGEDAEGLETYFKKVADNIIIILDGVGGMFSGLSALGENAAIGKFFDRIKDAGPAIGNVADKGLEALPAVADLVVAFAELVDKLTDSGAIKLFFTIISNATQAVADILENKWLINILTFLGQVKAVTLAFGVLKGAVDLITLGLLGNVAAASGGFGKFFSFAKTELVGLTSFGGQFGNSLRVAGKSFNSSFTPTLFGRFKDFFINAAAGFGAINVQSGILAKGLSGLSRVFLGNPILLALTLIIGAFATLYATNEEFRKSFEPVIASIGMFFNGVFVAMQPLMAAFAELYENHIKPLLFGPNGNDGLISGLSWFVANVLPPVINAIANTLIPIISLLSSFVATAIGSFGDFFEGIKTMFMALGLLFQGDFIGALKMGVGGFLMAIMSVVDFVANIIVDVLNFVIDKINQALALLAGNPLGDFARDVLGFDVSVGIPKIPRANFSSQVGKALGLAKGGIVSPRGGGTMALIAEAGRPERVEPLDPDGLSKRDKAMIQFLTNGNAGGINITVNPSAGMDETELAGVISRRLAYELRRGATA